MTAGYDAEMVQRLGSMGLGSWGVTTLPHGFRPPTPSIPISISPYPVGLQIAIT